MTCDAIERGNTIERYLNGRLGPAEKEEWEIHYFGCSLCAQRLETWQAVAGPLRAMAPAIRREIEPPRRRAWLWTGAGIAAALLLAAIALSPMRSGRTPVPVPLELAHLDPPAYTPGALRGAGSPAERAFQEAMQAYQSREFSQAGGELRAALELDPHAAAPRFFLGACYLLLGKADDGIRELRVVAEGGSPFAEEARFDLAKGYLMRGDKDAAREALRMVAALHSDFSARADELLRKIQ